MDIIREPKQQRAKEKKEKIIKAGFDLICKNGYHNTNTAQIAKEAGVSTGIVYQYFKDKHAIFMEALNVYGDKIFFPMLNNKIELNNNIDIFIKNIINNCIDNNRVSEIAHEEIMSMVHSDHEVAEFYYNIELQTTEKIKKILLDNNFKDNNLYEKVHIMIGMIDHLCHEIIYHQHHDMDYSIMTNLVTNNIKELFKNDLN